MAILIRLAPDYRALCAALPRHSRKSIEGKASKLGLRKALHWWTAAQVARLGNLWEAGAPVEQILAELPFATPVTIQNQVQFNGFRRPKVLEWPALPSVAAAVQGRGWSWRELDRRCGTDGYFAKRRHKGVVWKNVAKATDVLGLRVDVEWEPL